MNDIDRLSALMERTGAGEIEWIVPLAAAASTRRYYRISVTGGRSYVGAIGQSEEENRAFFEIARCLEAEKIPAPRVIAVEDGGGAYIVTDLGVRSMMDAVAQAARSGQWEGSAGLAALEACMDLLPELQYGVARRIDASKCYPRGAMDRRSVMWDLNHFKYCFLKAAAADMDEEGLENDFERLAGLIGAQEGGPFWAFIHRDCQSRNVMLTPGGSVAWIDFQGGRMGPVAYDFASMVWHGRSGIPRDIRYRLMARYVAALSEQVGRMVTIPEFEEMLRPVLLLRLLQVLGAYGLRGITEGKAAFITPMPSVVAELEALAGWVRDSGMPVLASTILNLHCLTPVAEAAEKREELIVTVMSFSYKRGLPRDYSGNGGGFVFDCRYPNNPGRYEKYRNLTGRDQEVIEFLESDGEMPQLARRAVETVMPAVERYRKRGFTHLSVSFGCTGGQHRSVYGAEYMARALREAGVKVRLIHREQGITVVE